jgi:hypothetical protein
VIGFVVGSALDWVWQLPVVAIVALVALGLLAGPATAGVEGAAAAPARLRFGTRAALVLGSWLAVVAVAIPFLAAEELGASERGLARGDVASALERARSAEAIEPWASTPRLQLALAYEQAGSLGAARRRIDEAIERDSSDWRLRIVDARLAVKAGDVAAGRRALARARSLNPRSRLLRALGPQR